MHVIRVHFLSIRHLIVGVHLVPSVAGCRQRKDAGEDIVHHGGDEEARKVIDVVDILSPQGDGTTDSARKADDIDKDTREIRGIRMPGESEDEVIWPSLAGAIEIFDLKVAFAVEIVVTDHGTGNGRQEDRIGREICGELVGRRHKVPLSDVSPCPNAAKYR